MSGITETDTRVTGKENNKKVSELTLGLMALNTKGNGATGKWKESVV